MLDSYLSVPQQWNRYAYAINSPLKYVDPSGEVIHLTGTPEEQQRALERIKKLLGPERSKYINQSQIRDAGGQITTVLSYDSGNARAGMERIGQTELDVEFSVRMADILESSEVVEYRLAESYEAKDGKHKVSEWGGAVTVGKGDSLNGNVQIFVHPTRATSMAEDVLNSIGGASKWTGGGRIDFYDDIVDAHEFGHAHEGIKGGIPGSSLGNTKAVRMENAIRERRQMKQRRVRE